MTIDIAQTSYQTQILIAEDDPNIRSLLEAYLSVSGFQTHAVEDGAQAWQAFQTQGFDLVILDVMMPGLTGFEVCELIRSQSQVGVLMLTALGEEEDRVKGFISGGDDYVVKPFSPRELVMRVQALLRRSQAHISTRPTNPPPQQSALWLDADACRALYEGRDLDLTPSEYKITAALVQRQGRVMSRDDLLDVLYPNGEAVVQKSVDVHVHNIRRKLGEDGANILQTVRGFGYRFVEQTL